MQRPAAPSQLQDIIHHVRGKAVILDRDLALLYRVETRALNQAVKRNPERFPADFMFQLDNEEFNNLRSQIATANWEKRRTNPYAFTEHGVLMLSTVLNSDFAIQTNILIIRVFTKIRYMLDTNQELISEIKNLRSKLIEHDNEILHIFKFLTNKKGKE